MNILHSVEIKNVPKENLGMLTDFLEDNGITDYDIWLPTTDLDDIL